MQKGIDARWMYSIVPLSAITNGLSILIPLYILEMHGNVFDVGIAFALFNLVTIPSVIFWGKITDKVKRNKPFIMFSVIFTLPILLLLYLYKGVYETYLYYSIFAIVSAASFPAINILIMGTKRSKSLPKYFSRYGIFGVIGAIIAFALGTLISQSELFLYSYILVILDIIGIALAMALIKEKRIADHKKRKNSEIFSILKSVAHFPYITFSLNSIKIIHFYRMKKNHVIRHKESKGLYQLLASIAAFNFAYYFFNSSYIPYLKVYGITYTDIFIINLLNVIGQAIMFIIIIRKSGALNLHRYYTNSTAYRGIGYFIIMLSAFLPLGLFLPINILVYVMLGFAITVWNLSSALLIYEKIRGFKAGYYVGIWTSVLGSSAVLGSFISGLVSLMFGYSYTFIIATLFCIVSIILFKWKSKGPKKI